MNPSSLLIEQIHFLEQSIFKEFALETSNNIHLKSVDLNNPLTSIYKIILCDIVTSQMYSTSVELPKIIPKSIYVKDNNSQKCSYIKFNNDGVSYIEEFFYDLNDEENLLLKIDSFRKLVLKNNPLFYCKERLEKYEVTDVSVNQALEKEFTCLRSIEFKNSDYPDIRPDEIVNYTIEINHKIYPNHKSIDLKIVTAYLTKISSLALHVKRNKKNYLEIENQSTRAAISQVMARNTSHNIGAHVMNKLIGNLRELSFLSYESGKNYCTQIQLRRDIHKDIVQRLENNSAFKTFDSTTKEEALRNELLLGQVAFFNNYVKCRMDYLADISFGTPLMQTNKYAFTDLFKELDKVRLLLEYISGLGENFKYEIKFKYNDKEMSDENDLPIAIPNDILGMQAFYNILENIIRNTAKHAKQKPLTTTFTINFIDKLEKADPEQQNILNDYIAVEVYDNIAVKGSKRDLTSEEKKEYESIMHPSVLDNFASEIDALVFSQNSRINANILKYNQLRSGALGVIEMDASAAYLRKRDVSFINHDNYTVRYDDSWSANSVKAQNNDCERGVDCRHFLKAFKKEISKHVDNDAVFALGYRFFLLRPEVVLIVTNIEPDTDKNFDKVKELKKQGIWFVKPDVFEKHLTEGKVYNHEFVIIDKNILLPKVKVETEPQNNSETEIDWMIYYKTSLPLRILETQGNELTTLFSEINDDNKKDWLNVFEDFCWEKWEKYNFSQKLNIRKSYSTKSESEAQAIFLDHLYSDGTNGSPEENWNKNIEAKYIEALSSLAQTKLPDFTKLTKETNNSEKKIQKYLEELNYNSVATLNNNLTTYRKLKESILSKIIVVDERIQYASENNYFISINYCAFYAKMNVVVPNKINLSDSSFSETVIDNIEQFIKSEINGVKKTDHILIHYSILERMYKAEEINIRVKDLIGKSLINIVITSGRGVPEKLSNKFRFVNLSSVITAFIDHRNKYSINYLLNSSRKPSKK